MSRAFAASSMWDAVRKLYIKKNERPCFRLRLYSTPNLFFSFGMRHDVSHYLNELESGDTFRVASIGGWV